MVQRPKFPNHPQTHLIRVPLVFVEHLARLLDQGYLIYCQVQNEAGEPVIVPEESGIIEVGSVQIPFSRFVDTDADIRYFSVGDVCLEEVTGAGGETAIACDVGSETAIAADEMVQEEPVQNLPNDLETRVLEDLLQKSRELQSGEHLAAAEQDLFEEILVEFVAGNETAIAADAIVQNQPVDIWDAKANEVNLSGEGGAERVHLLPFMSKEETYRTIESLLLKSYRLQAVEHPITEEQDLFEEMLFEMDCCCGQESKRLTSVLQSNKEGEISGAHEEYLAMLQDFAEELFTSWRRLALRSYPSRNRDTKLWGIIVPVQSIYDLSFKSKYQGYTFVSYLKQVDGQVLEVGSEKVWLDLKRDEITFRLVLESSVAGPAMPGDLNLQRLIESKKGADDWLHMNRMTPTQDGQGEALYAKQEKESVTLPENLLQMEPEALEQKTWSLKELIDKLIGH